MKTPIQLSVPHIVRKLFFPARVLVSVGLAQNGLMVRLDDGLGSSRAARLIKPVALAQPAMTSEERAGAARAAPASPAESAAAKIGSTVFRDGVSNGTCYPSSSALKRNSKVMLCADEVWRQ